MRHVPSINNSIRKECYLEIFKKTTQKVKTTPRLCSHILINNFSVIIHRGQSHLMCVDVSRPNIRVSINSGTWTLVQFKKKPDVLRF